MRSFFGVAAMAVAMVLAAGCDDDDGMGPEAVDLTGTWTYSATNLAGGGLTCSFTGIQATVQQSASTFSGTTQGGSYLCESLLGNLGADLGAQTISGGTIAGSDVGFQIDGVLLFTHSGTVSGNSMSGTVVATGSVDPVGQVALSGSWTASR